MSTHLDRIRITALDRALLIRSGLAKWPAPFGGSHETGLKLPHSLAQRRARLDAAMAEVSTARELPRGAIVEIAKRHGVSPESIHTRIFNERRAGAKPRKAA